ncbi:MAG: GtrA family protein [Shinella sp.]|nr:GtrA family protein [Shinella sp.]
MKRLGWFAVAGGIGFLVDAGTLAVLLATTALGPFPSRIVAIAAAMLATWIVNRSFTFGASPHSRAAEGTRYGAIGLTGAAINYAIYSGLILALPGFSPVLAVALSSGLAMLWSWLGYSRFVFGTSSPSK